MHSVVVRLLSKNSVSDLRVWAIFFFFCFLIFNTGLFIGIC